jgi:phosphorylase kinase alpha/beta subunit
MLFSADRIPSSPSLMAQNRLDAYYQDIKAVILSRQHPITGLLPASTAVNSHGDYTDAWVRDNVYSILGVWGLALAYRKLDRDQGRAYELEHSVVKLMRGLLVSMMKQANKIERFKVTQAPIDSLHAKYSTKTGDTVVADHEWGHLQLDATSLYLLMLAQMTASGLRIIYTLDEVNVVQNLVYYIGRAYRTPDYGIWERGNKINHGDPELNASSIGMAKAALEAMNGFNLFGMDGDQASVIHVLPDEIARTRSTLESLLPRESGSKEVDGALLSIIGFPAFAVDNDDLIDRTRQNVVEKLQGNYGCKRFLRDGHQTVIEDSNRLHYEPIELRQFEHIECEWPLFFSYLLLDSIFRHDHDQIEEYQDRLKSVLVKQGDRYLLPELFYVPEDCIEAEREQPGSQTRLPNDNIPLVWAQSLYYLGQLMVEDLLSVGDIDPLGRHLKLQRPRSPIVQIALLSEDEELQSQLANYGIPTQVPSQVEPVQVRYAVELSVIYSQIGRNDELGISGRPVRRLRSLTTSRFFRIHGETIIFLPSFLDQQQFYLVYDYHFLVAQIKGELTYIQRHWSLLGQPTMALLLTHKMFEAGKPSAIAESPLLQLIQELQQGHCNDVTVRVAPLNQLMATAGVERIDFVHEFRFSQSPVKQPRPKPRFLQLDLAMNRPLTGTQEFTLEQETKTVAIVERLRHSQNLYEQIELLDTLCEVEDRSYEIDFESDRPVTVADLLDEVYEKAAQLELWSIIRKAAGLLSKIDIGLSDAVTEILVRQKQITVGKAFSQASLIDRPMPHLEIMQKIDEFCGEDVRDRSLTQEVLIYLSILIKAEPTVFKGFLTLRVSYLILLITTELAQERHISQAEAYEQMMQLSPFEIKTRLRQVLTGYEGHNKTLMQQESLHVRQQQAIQWVVLPDQSDALTVESWRRQRQLNGSLNRVPDGFYPNVWQVMCHCKGLVVGDKLERRNCLDSDVILSEMTPEEKNFALRVEHLLNKIQAPEYRQVNIEALMELAAIAEQNPDLHIEEYIVMDVLIGHAVRLGWLEHHPEHHDRYDEFKAQAWQSFYDSPPHTCAAYVAKSLQFLTELGQSGDVDDIAIAQ